MIIKNIELKNFRNYEHLELVFDKQKTLIIGQNGMGKTNLLEGIFYLSALNSNRIKKDSELILFNKEICQIKGEVFKNNIDIELEVNISQGKNKIYKVNGLKKNKSSDFIRVLSAISFSSADLALLRGEPSFRRKWLDMAICQIYPVYSEKISKYNKIRLQKANLLSQYNFDMNMLDVFNAQLATSGANIIFLRNKFLKELEKIAIEKHLQIAQNENLKLTYDSEYKGSAKEIENALYEALEKNKNEEIRKCQCLIGPHREDISFFINEIDSKKYASQGQQRTIVLALKLAELEIVKEKNSTSPILLLDDVLAELDIGRQNFLLDNIENDIQTFITTTDVNGFKNLENTKIIKIENGKLL